MNTLDLKYNAKVETVYFTRDALVVDLMDGRTISAPLTWYPKLERATQKQRSNWEVCGGGQGIHWPEIDEDLSVEGLLRGSPAPNAKIRISKRAIKQGALRANRRTKAKAKSKAH